MKKQSFDRSDWFRKYPELNSHRKKPDKAKTLDDIERTKRKKKLDLIEEGRELADELGEIWDD